MYLFKSVHFDSFSRLTQSIQDRGVIFIELEKLILPSKSYTSFTLVTLIPGNYAWDLHISQASTKWLSHYL